MLGGLFDLFIQESTVRALIGGEAFFILHIFDLLLVTSGVAIDRYTSFSR